MRENATTTTTGQRQSHKVAISRMDASSKTIFIYFWLFGLINNVLYVVILSAAADIVGPRLPKSIVLLADIFPSFLVKLFLPFFVDRIPYTYRIWCLILLGCTGMILVATGSIAICMLGIVLASSSSGLGEVTFLQITHYYEHSALNGWSSGTGGAGIVGSGMYMLLTTILGLPTSLALLLFSALQFGFLLYFRLELVPIKKVGQYKPINYEENLECPINATNNDSFTTDSLQQQDSGMLSSEHLKQTFGRIRPLIIPYMLPLTSVYFFEYLINQGVSPTLLFPIGDHQGLPSYFQKYRDIYVTYGTLYQLGVFISRSSARFVRLRRLYLLSVLQGLNLLILILQSWLYIVHSIWYVMLLVFYEGLLGGASYVNTFMNILDDVEQEEREFSLGAVSISDSFGTLLAAFTGLFLEPKLCEHQVQTGRPWCTLP